MKEIYSNCLWHFQLTSKSRHGYYSSLNVKVEFIKPISISHVNDQLVINCNRQTPTIFNDGNCMT